MIQSLFFLMLIRKKEREKRSGAAVDGFNTVVVFSMLMCVNPSPLLIVIYQHLEMTAFVISIRRETLA